MGETAFPAPICKVGENIGVWAVSKWNFYQVLLIEKLPYSSSQRATFGAATAGQALAKTNAVASGQTNSLVSASENELLQWRFKPLDDVEVVLWLPAGQPALNTNYVQSAVSLATEDTDPYWESTEFFNLGTQRDPQFAITSLAKSTLNQVALAFWGRKYRLKPLDQEPMIYTRVIAEAVGLGKAG